MNQNKYLIHPVCQAVTFVMAFLLLSFSLIHAAPAEFFYDAQGRLVGVKDETGNMAVHRYDAVGNLLSIDNLSQTAGNVGIFLLLPEKGVVGETIDIQGFGFSNVSTENTVTFNGTAATVISSSFDSLTITVPVGATSGPVVVSNIIGNATSPQPFTILTTPMILSIDPASVTQGSSNVMVIHGENLAATNGITFSSGSLSAVFLTAPTPNKIKIKLDVDSGTPLGAYSFTLTSPTGNIQSGAVLVNVNSADPTMSVIRKGVSVFIPKLPGMPEGPSMTVAPPISVSMP